MLEQRQRCSLRLLLLQLTAWRRILVTPIGDGLLRMMVSRRDVGLREMMMGMRQQVAGRLLRIPSSRLLLLLLQFRSQLSAVEEASGGMREAIRVRSSIRSYRQTLLHSTSG